jgi:CubicO group peptidase (beta-lactamase class C family)
MIRPLPFLLMLALLWPCMTDAQSLPPAIAPLLDSLRTQLDKDKVPGMMLTLVRNDSVLFAGVLGQGRPGFSGEQNNALRFRLGSISKTFTSLAILKLVHEGKLKLDDRLADLAPEIPVKNRWEKTHPLRVVHLLEHTTGFDDMKLSALYNRSGRRLSAREQVEIHKKSLVCRWQPGTRMSYSNPGYAVAGYLVEKITGEEFEAYVEQEILRPAGMATADFVSFPADYTGYAQGYEPMDSVQPVPFHPISAVAAGSLNANATDMAACIKFMLAAGKAKGSLGWFNAEVLTRMEKPASTTAAKQGLAVGYGLGNYVSGWKMPSLFHGHNGGIDGFVSSFAYNHQFNAGYAFSLNLPTATQKYEQMVLRFLVHYQSARPPAAVPINEEELEPFLGHYAEKSPRNKFLSGINGALRRSRLYVEGDSLRWQSPEGNTVTLIHAGKMQFFIQGQNSPRFALFEDESGQQVISDQGSYEVKSPQWKMWTYATLLGLSGLVSVTFLLVGLVFFILALTRSLPRSTLWVTVPVWTGVVSLIVMGVLFFTALEDIYQLGAPSTATQVLYLCSLYVGLASLAGLSGAVYMYPRTGSTVLSLYLTLVALSLVYLSWILMQDGLIGVKMWDLS